MHLKLKSELLFEGDNVLNTIGINSENVVQYLTSIHFVMPKSNCEIEKK